MGIAVRIGNAETQVYCQGIGIVYHKTLGKVKIAFHILSIGILEQRVLPVLVSRRLAGRRYAIQKVSGSLHAGTHDIGIGTVILGGRVQGL